MRKFSLHKGQLSMNSKLRGYAKLLEGLRFK